MSVARQKDDLLLSETFIGTQGGTQNGTNS